MKLFCAMWCFVALVSGYDTYRSLADVEGFLLFEMNPMARWVVFEFGVPAFAGIKVVGTALSLGVVGWLWGWCRRWSEMCMCALCGVQLGVLLTYCRVLWSW
jgi:hypothetical protein